MDVQERSSAGQTAAKAGIVRFLDRVNEMIAIVCKVIIVATGTVLLVLLTASVVSRYFFNFSLVWVGEVPERLFPWMITAGVALAAVSNSHIAVDLFLKLLPATYRRVLIIAIQLLIIGTYAVIAKVAMEVAEITAFELSPVLNLPGSHGYYAFAIGATLVAVAAFSTLIRFLVTGNEPEAGSLGQEHTQ